MLGDVVVPVDPDDAVTPLDAAHDRPSPLAEQLAWLAGAGFRATVTWQRGDLAVIVADRPEAR